MTQKQKKLTHTIGIFAFLFLALSINLKAQTDEIKLLQPEQTIERELAGGQTHKYKFEAKANEFLNIKVEQKGVDVVVRLFDAGGRQLAEINSPNGTQDFEDLAFITSDAGVYQIEVGSLETNAPKGNYTILRKTPRAATEKDKKTLQVKTIYDEAFGLFNQGTAESYKAALEKFQQASRLYSEIDDKSEKAGLSLLVSGLISDRLGEKAKALEYYNKALKFFQEIESKELEALTLNNIGLVYSDLGEKQKALEYYNQSLPLRRVVGDKSGEATTLSNIGAVYSDLGEKQKALEYFNQSLPLSRVVGDKSKEALTLSNIGAVYSDLGENQKALEYFNQSLPLSRQVGDKSGEAMTSNNLMSVWETLQNPRVAVFYGKQSVNIYQQLRSNIKGLDKSVQQTYLKSIETTYRRLADIMIAEGRLIEAQAVLDLLKEEEFSALLRRSGNAEDSIPYSKAEAAAIEILDRLAALGREKGELGEKNEKDALNEAEKGRFREIAKDIEIAEAEFNKSIAALSSEKNKGKNFDTVVTDAQAFMEDLKNLGKGTVALYTVIVDGDKPEIGDEKSEIKTGWVILVTPEFRKAFPIDVKDLEKTVFEFRGALLNDKYDPQPVAQEFYKKLFLQKGKDGKTLEADLKEYFKNKPEKTLMWSLDGVLRYVPMAALHDGDSYLVEKYRMTLFNTASKARLKDVPKANWTALGLGVSAARVESEKSFPKLPGAKRELDEIVKETDADDGIFNGTIKMDEQFTAAAMQDALAFDKNPVVHIASHFSFNAGNVDESFLLLGEGKMTVKELTAKSTLFTNVDLLALSACDTAVGSSNGKEIEGFAYVAQSLGAKAVLASLWQVSDDGTDELMVRFYDQRSKNPQLSKGEAFRQAQLEMLGGTDLMAKGGSTEKRSGVFTAGNQKLNLPEFKKDANNPFAHPHYWAAFVLIGNWR